MTRFSSFDSHNLFNIQALLIRSVKDYGQIFSLAHNFYFFAKMKDTLKVIFKQPKNKNNAENLEIFEIENRKDSSSISKHANKYIRKGIYL
jgi:wobble nucleotide-excising tRNase